MAQPKRRLEMAKRAKPLTEIGVKSKRHSGRTNGDERHADGNGLYLNVKASGAKSWVMRLVVDGRRCIYGIGGYPLVSLAEARDTAFEHRRLARRGGSPLAMRASRKPDFAAAAKQVIDHQEGAWKEGSRTRADWEASLETYALPLIGAKPVDRITSADVMAVLNPIWHEKRATAERVRRRIGMVMRWAMAQGHRADDPAQAVLQALAKNGKREKKHHAALPHGDVGHALDKVRKSGAWARLAFEWLVLTATRSGEVRGATWDEIDLPAAMWTIPAARMKGGVEHRVPLSGRCLEILAEARGLGDGTGIIFPGMKGNAITNNSFTRLVAKLGIDATPHGFRSSFRDWAAERTDAPKAVMEAALAHSNPNAVEAAYARSDLLDKRRELMAAWADYVAG